MPEGNAIYPVHCTECGDVISTKLFRLDDVLRKYYVEKSLSPGLDTILRILDISGTYGAAVLSDAPPLVVKQNGSYHFHSPNLNKIRDAAPNLKCFECEDNKVPQGCLTPINLSISSIVAQFYRNTGSEIYQMLSLQMKINDLEDQGADTAKPQKLLNDLCDKFSQLSCIRRGAMGSTESNQRSICRMLRAILAFAQAEADHLEEDGDGTYHGVKEESSQADKKQGLFQKFIPKKNIPEQAGHFSLVGPILLGWRYKTINGRKMPFSLVACSTGGGFPTYFDNAQCLCDKCRNPVPYEFGAYEQFVVGVLGTQSTGKTTYLAALADAIECNEATTYLKQKTNLLITHNSADPQWKRVKDEGGILWLYQHGYPPKKTKVTDNETPALSFLVENTNRSKEPKMFTLADIPGEAFYNTVSNEFSPQQIAALTRLQKASSMLLMVINSQQLHQDAPQVQADAAEKKLVRDANEVLDCYKALPSKPTAVVLTAMDLVNSGDLREPLQLAFDIRKLSPLVWSHSQQTLVYNAEAMASAIRAVREYVNFNFNKFMDNVTQQLKGAVTAAFVVSNGTQCAPWYYYDDTDEEKQYLIPDDYHSPHQEELRLESVRGARFGVTAPLLWLLAYSGMLEVGRGENDYNDYDGDIREAIRKQLENSLRS